MSDYTVTYRTSRNNQSALFFRFRLT